MENNFEKRQKPFQNWSRSGYARVWGSIWEVFGMLRGVSWAPLGDSWAVFAPSKCHFFTALVQDKLQELFGMDSGSIWGGFGMDLGRILDVFSPFWRDWGQALNASGETQPCWGRSSTWTPALTREASQYAGVLPPAWWTVNLNEQRYFFLA